MSAMGTLVQEIQDYEEGLLDGDQVIELYQKLVDSGYAWELQGNYGRMAVALIEAGLVTTQEKRERDDLRRLLEAWS